jgi:hypothetical protein
MACHQQQFNLFYVYITLTTHKFYVYLYKRKYYSTDYDMEFWTFRHRNVSAPFIQIAVNCHFYGIKHILVQVLNRWGAETSCTHDMHVHKILCNGDVMDIFYKIKHELQPSSKIFSCP